MAGFTLCDNGAAGQRESERIKVGENENHAQSRSLGFTPGNNFSGITVEAIDMLRQLYSDRGIDLGKRVDGWENVFNEVKKGLNVISILMAYSSDGNVPDEIVDYLIHRYGALIVDLLEQMETLTITFKRDPDYEWTKGMDATTEDCRNRLQNPLLDDDVPERIIREWLNSQMKTPRPHTEN